MQLAGPSRRPLRAAAPRGWAVLVLALVVVAVAAAAGAALTGASSAPPLADPGPAVRYGLPLVVAVDDLAAAVTLGVLVLAGTAPTAGSGRPEASTGPHRGPLRRAHQPALRLVCAAGVTWALAALARLVLGYAAATGQGLQQPDLGTQLVSYVTQVDAGRWAAAAVVLAALVATVAAATAGLVTTRLLVVPAALALTAEVVAAHAGSGGLSGPGPAGTGAVVVIGLHVAGVALWVGALAGLLLLVPRPAGGMGSAVTAYVRFADWAWGLIAVSGVLAAWQQLGGSAGIRTAYAGLVAVKLVVLAVVGAFGARHRRRVLPSVAAGDRAALVRGVALELLAAALAIGLSGALAATDPPAATATVAADLASVAGR